MGVLALGLGVLTIGGASWRLWQVYAFAFLLRSVTAFDVPARQAFVAELAGGGEPVERRRAQLHLLQRGAHDRPGDRGRADIGRRSGGCS